MPALATSPPPGLELIEAPLPVRCCGHAGGVTGLALTPETPDGVFLVSASHDGSAMLRDADTGDWVGTFGGHQGPVWSADLCGEAAYAATGGSDATMRYWDATTGEELLSIPHGQAVRSVRVSRHDRRRVLTAEEEGGLRVFDISRPAEPGLFRAACQQQSPETLLAATFGRDDALIFSGSAREPKLRCWDIRTLRCELAVPLPGPLCDLELSQDEAVLTVATRSHVLLFDSARGLRKRYEHDLRGYGDFEGASLHPGGRGGDEGGVFAAGEANGIVRTFAARTGQEVQRLKGHAGRVTCVRFHPSGDHLASGSEDGSVVIWPLSAAGVREGE